MKRKGEVQHGNGGNGKNGLWIIGNLLSLSGICFIGDLNIF